MIKLAAEFEALAAIDPAFGAALARWGEPHRIDGEAREDRTRFAALTRSIMGQQRSVKAAATIHGRVVDLLGVAPTPELVLQHEEAALRACGLSGAKIRSLHEIARAVQAGDIDLDALDHLTEDDAAARLVALPGVGPWTAHMFLMFVLGRPDVLAPGDVGVQNGIRVIFAMEVRPAPKEVTVVAENQRADASLACADVGDDAFSDRLVVEACRLAWHVLDTAPLPTPTAQLRRPRP